MESPEREARQEEVARTVERHAEDARMRTKQAQAAALERVKAAIAAQRERAERTREQIRLARRKIADARSRAVRTRKGARTVPSEGAVPPPVPRGR